VNPDGCHCLALVFRNHDVDLTGKAVKIVYGRIHWERLLQNLRQPRTAKQSELFGTCQVKLNDRHASGPRSPIRPL
jgi:hypothetical protein